MGANNHICTEPSVVSGWCSQDHASCFHSNPFLVPILGCIDLAARVNLIVSILPCCSVEPMPGLCFSHSSWACQPFATRAADLKDIGWYPLGETNPAVASPTQTSPMSELVSSILVPCVRFYFVYCASISCLVYTLTSINETKHLVDLRHYFLLNLWL